MAGKGKEPAGEHQVERIVQPGASITCRTQPTRLINLKSQGLIPQRQNAYTRPSIDVAKVTWLPSDIEVANAVFTSALT